MNATIVIFLNFTQFEFIDFSSDLSYHIIFGRENVYDSFLFLDRSLLSLLLSCLIIFSLWVF